MRAALTPLVLLTLCAAPAGAQQRLVHDTLGSEVPTALSCGFCADERFGVVFRELDPPRRGLGPEDFPIVLDTVEIGLAAADVSGGLCAPRASGGQVLVALEIWVGSAPPSAAIRDHSPIDGWPGEELVFATDAAPVGLSVADDTGRYEVVFTVLDIRDEAEAPIRVEAGSYVRVSVTLPTSASGSSDVCEPTYEPPGGIPLRDDDGLVASQRSFIYAAGQGFLWNEEAGVTGDWGLRLGLFTEGRPSGDAGAPSLDAGVAATEDAGPTPIDGGASPDAGTETDGGCRVSPAGSPIPWLAGVLWALALRGARRVR